MTTAKLRPSADQLNACSLEGSLQSGDFFDATLQRSL